MPEPLKPYQGSGKRSFWDAKSKGPFKWDDPREADAYPWIQFLGYQIRHDGVVRVRQSSINRELTKQVQVTGRVLHSLRPENVSNIRRDASTIVHSFKLKLISMGIGRRKRGQDLDGPMPKCWANGFRWLSGKNAITNNLRGLDRQRERQINRVVRRLKGLDPTACAQLNHQGFPFSYVGQFSGKPAGEDDGKKAQ